MMRKDHLSCIPNRMIFRATIIVLLLHLGRIRNAANAFQPALGLKIISSTFTTRVIERWKSNMDVTSSSVSSLFLLNAGINGNDESTFGILEPLAVIDTLPTTGIDKKDDIAEEESGNEFSLYNNIFDIVAGRAATCLVESDLRRDAKEGYSKITSSSATNWINDATAFQLQKAFDRIKLKVSRHQ